MTSAPERPQVGLIDDPKAPDLYADSASGFFLMNGNLRITLEVARINHSTKRGEASRVVVGRLVMPSAAAESVARGILDIIEKNRKSPTPSLQGSPTIQ